MKEVLVHNFNNYFKICEEEIEDLQNDLFDFLLQGVVMIKWFKTLIYKIKVNWNIVKNKRIEKKRPVYLQMSYKYVIGCGCSFLETHLPGFYQYHLRIIPTSKGGCGNEFIRHQITYKISELISNNVNPKDIFVVKWTRVLRLDLYVQKGQTITQESFHHDLEPTRLGSHVTIGEGVSPDRKIIIVVSFIVVVGIIMWVNGNLNHLKMIFL